MEFKKNGNKKFVLFGLILLFCCVGIFGGAEEGKAQATCGSFFCDPLVPGVSHSGNSICANDLEASPWSWCLSGSKESYHMFCAGDNTCINPMISELCNNNCCQIANDNSYSCVGNICTDGGTETCAEACANDGFDSAVGFVMNCSAGLCADSGGSYYCFYDCQAKAGTTSPNCTCYNEDLCGANLAECNNDCTATGCGGGSIGDCSNLTCEVFLGLTGAETCNCGTAVCTSAHNCCCADHNSCYGVCAECDPVIGATPCLAAGCPAGQTDPHNTCVAGTCQSVSGCGANDCSACSGCPAGQTDPHSACVAGTCQSVSGCGGNDCSACSGAACVPPCVSPEVCSAGACVDPTGPSTVWPVTFTNPLDAESFEELIANVINWLLAIVGSIVLLFIIIAGIMYMTAAGDEAQLTRAKKMLFYTILGFAIILISYSLIKEIKDILGITS